MRKLRRREIKHLSQGQGWVKCMIGLTLITCDPGVSMCLTRATGMGREVCVTLERMSLWSMMCLAFLLRCHFLDGEKLPFQVCKSGSCGIRCPLPSNGHKSEQITLSLQATEIISFSSHVMGELHQISRRTLASSKCFHYLLKEHIHISLGELIKRNLGCSNGSRINLYL